MRVVVTGANGFVGRVLCAALRAKGYEVVSVVRSKSLDEQVAIGEIGPETQWQGVLHACDVVVHLAARTHVLRESADDPMALFRRVNFSGTVHLARQAAKAGVKRFVFISSIHVNGHQTTDQSFTETDLPNPQDFYAISKYEAEIEVREIAEKTGMEAVILRPPLVYGVQVPGNFRALVHAVRKGVPLPLGSVHNRRSLVALDNLVDFIALCADRERSPQAANELFLISDGDDVSTTELLRQVAHAYGKKVRLFPVPEAWLRGGAKLLGKAAMADRLLGSLVVDSSKASRLLGWQPVVTMVEQLRKMAQHDAI